jgi:hypothetical protein
MQNNSLNLFILIFQLFEILHIQFIDSIKDNLKISVVIEKKKILTSWNLIVV